uniref:Checkpoint protein n=1 Tax=Rhodnius prolixus TaxID=13249 RepID=R4FKD6_RHOPR
MKFRAKLAEWMNMKNLAFLATTLSKLTKTCVLKMTKAQFTLLICEENSSPKQILLWCVIDAPQFFNEYDVEGVTRDDKIFLELPTEMLSSSLNTLKSGGSNIITVKIKLTDKMSPCITVEIELSTEYGMTRSCVHDIPVRIIHMDYWKEFKDPPAVDYDATVEIINLKKIRNVIERLKRLCPFIKVGVSSERMLCISAESQAVSCVTLFKNCTLISHKEGEEEQCFRIDAKRLCMLLTCEQLNSRRTLLHFYNNVIHFNLNCDHFFIHFHVATTEE